MMQKLSSRKFWCAVIGFVTALLIAFGVEPDSVAQVAAIMSAFGVLVGYMLGEGIADSGGKGKGARREDKDV